MIRTLHGPARRRPPHVRPGNAATPRRRPAAAEPVALDPHGRDDEVARVEAALFLAADPLPAKKLATVAGLPTVAAATAAVARLAALLDADGSAYAVEEIAGGFQLLMRPDFYPWLARLRNAAEGKLSPTQLETLAAVAYRQPIGRADLEAIRGVQCGEPLRQLMELKLIELAGRDASLGRPHLYRTTKLFLQRFGLRTLADLPTMDG